MALVDLGLTDGFFWGLTPRAWQALLQQKRRAREMEIRHGRVLAGTVAAAVYNVNRDTKKRPEPLSYADIFPEPQKRQSEAQVKAVFLNLAAGWKARSGSAEKADEE